MTDLLLCTSYFLAYEAMPGARGQPYVSLGVLYLAAYLRRSDCRRVEVFDATFADGLAAFESALDRLRPKAVGIQSVITTRQIARQMIAIAKRYGATVIVGGPDPSVLYESYLQWGADMVVIGEGEHTLEELLLHLEAAPDAPALDDIAGLAFAADGRLCVTPARPPIRDIDSLPFPAYDLVDVARYLETWRQYNGYSSMHFMMSRGCPFNCSWCSHAVFGRTYRQRSVANVLAEMRLLEQSYGPDHLTIADDTLGLNKKWLADWSGAIERDGPRIPFRCFSRADVITATIVAQLKAAGCRHIYLGVESGSQRILDRMNKGTTLPGIRRASALIKDAGIDLGYFIMFAYPGETFEDIHRTLELIFQMAPDSLGLSIAYPVPGTAFYEEVKGRLVPDEADEPVMGSGRRVKFKATYPEAYYQCLLRYIERRRSLETTSARASIPLRLRVAADRSQLQFAEWLWPVLKGQRWLLPR